MRGIPWFYIIFSVTTGISVPRWYTQLFASLTSLKIIHRFSYSNCSCWDHYHYSETSILVFIAPTILISTTMVDGVDRPAWLTMGPHGVQVLDCQNEALKQPNRLQWPSKMLLSPRTTNLGFEQHGLGIPAATLFAFHQQRPVDFPWSCQQSFILQNHI